MLSSVEPAGWEPRYAARAERMRASEIRELLKVLDQPGIVSFAGGIPDPALFPVAEAKAAYDAIRNVERGRTEPPGAAPDSFLDPAAIAATYIAVLKHPRSAWSLEVELRPWVERF
jgi:hypothetical protein